MTRTTTKKPSRRAGRPTTDADRDVRHAIMTAAERLFLRHGFERVSARQIAAAAGSTPAMIHYYFGNKLGLFRAILERTIEPVRDLLRSAVHAERHELPDLGALMRLHMSTIAAHPWIANVLLNEVLSERGKFRPTFMREIAGPQLALLIELIEHGRRSGRFRADVEPRYAALSLLSLCVFPFLSRAVTGPLLAIDLSGEQLQHFIVHTTSVMLQGIAAK